MRLFISEIINLRDFIIEVFMRKMKKIRFIVPAVLIIWIVWTNFTIDLTRLTINNEKVPAEFSGFKIAHVSDLHNRDWKGQLIQKLEKEKPDAIFITGDLVDSKKTDIEIAMSFIDRALQISPVYYVTGNHEAWIKNYRELEKRLLKSGVVVMDDKSSYIEREGSKIQIVGIKDSDFAKIDKLYDSNELTIEKRLERLLDKELFSITLSHRPEIFDKYVHVGADLVLAGHAHGGQYRIPFVGGVIAPNQGLFPKYTSGVYTKENTSMVVSRGLGNSILRVRINNTPELIIVTLTNDD